MRGLDLDHEQSERDREEPSGRKALEARMRGVDLGHEQCERDQDEPEEVDICHPCPRWTSQSGTRAGPRARPSRRAGVWIVGMLRSVGPRSLVSGDCTRGEEGVRASSRGRASVCIGLWTRHCTRRPCR